LVDLHCTGFRMVRHRNVPGSSEEWDQVESDVPEYSVEDTMAAPDRTATALNIRYGPICSAPTKVSPTEALRRPGDIVIAVMGITGSGKSTFISHFAEGVIIGHTLEACK